MADAGGNHAVKKEKDRKTRVVNEVVANAVLAGLVFVLAYSLLALSPATPQSTQKEFATPKEAADAFIQAAEDFDLSALREILGADGEDLVSTEDPVQDKNRAAAFAAKAREKTEVTADPEDSKPAHSYRRAKRKVAFRRQGRP